MSTKTDEAHFRAYRDCKKQWVRVKKFTDDTSYISLQLLRETHMQMTARKEQKQEGGNTTS